MRLLPRAGARSRLSYTYTRQYRRGPQGRRQHSLFEYRGQYDRRQRLARRSDQRGCHQGRQSIGCRRRSSPTTASRPRTVRHHGIEPDLSSGGGAAPGREFPVREREHGQRLSARLDLCADRARERHADARPRITPMTPARPRPVRSIWRMPRRPTTTWSPPHRPPGRSTRRLIPALKRFPSCSRR